MNNDRVGAVIADGVSAVVSDKNVCVTDICCTESCCDFFIWDRKE
jgi:hypothetical protein